MAFLFSSVVAFATGLPVCCAAWLACEFGAPAWAPVHEAQKKAADKIAAKNIDVRLCIFPPVLSSPVIADSGAYWWEYSFVCLYISQGYWNDGLRHILLTVNLTVKISPDIELSFFCSNMLGLSQILKLILWQTNPEYVLFYNNALIALNIPMRL